MKKDTHKTKVQFLVNETNPDFANDVFAYFPEEYHNEEIYGKDMATCYAHVGQHSACHIDYAKESRKATEQEYNALKTELESIGYNLQII